MTQQNNLALWESVEKTDPAITKRVRYGKKNPREFTAICAQSQKKTATRIWGPFGKTWGLKDLRWSQMTGPDGTILEVTLDAVFWYPGGQFPISSDIAYHPGNDTRKKLRTDALTKALSDLGFNADVFMGRFDDNKYVAEMEREFRACPPGPPPNPRQEWERMTPADRAKSTLAAIEKAGASVNRLRLEELQKGIKEHPGDYTPQDRELLLEAIGTQLFGLHKRGDDATPATNPT